MFSVFKPVFFSIVVACLILAGLSVIGFPTQKIIDAGSAINYRLLSLDRPQLASPSAISGDEPEELPGQPDFMLPKTFYSMVGEELGVYFDNIILSPNAEKYRFSVSCDCDWASEYHRRKWSVIPNTQKESNVTFGVSDFSFNALKLASTRVRVASRDAGKDRKIKILIVGDSITRQGWWPNELGRLLNQANNPEWSMMGRTYSDGSPPFSESTIAKVRHEGEFGWSYTSFASFNDKTLAKSYHREKSPFVYGESPKTSQIDVPRYYSEQQDSRPPDFVFFLLGINDLWGSDPGNQTLFNQKADIVLDHARNLFNAFLEASPNTQVAILLPAPFSNSEATFTFSYKNTVNRWSARQVQHKLVQRMINEFGDQENERIWLLPLYATFDSKDGYPIDNAGHPNEYGQKQIAKSAFAWIKWILGEKK